jgi:hypothetical protein
MQVDPYRREYVLAQAVSAGKFAPERSTHYRTLYDRDPAGTEVLLARLASGVAAGGGAPYPRELFPELSSWSDAEVAAGVFATPVACPTSARGGTSTWSPTCPTRRERASSRFRAWAPGTEASRTSASTSPASPCWGRSHKSSSTTEPTSTALSASGATW